MSYHAAIKTMQFCLVFTTVAITSQGLSSMFGEPAPEIAADQILEASEASSQSVVIVDVRSQAESDVSRIPNAITQEEFEQEMQHHVGKRVVVYCTVGVRSAAYARRLLKSGWDAWNYKGGIIDWCNLDQPLVTPRNEPTTHVHTYSAKFSVSAAYVGVH